MYRICVLRRCSRHVICSVMVAATVIGRGNLAPTGISYRLIVLYLVPIDRRPWYSGEVTSPLRVIELSWSDGMSAGISYRLIVLYLVPIDRRPWYSGEGTSPLRMIELSWSDGMSAGISYRLIVLYLVPIDRRPWYSGEGTSPLRIIELSWSDGLSAGISYRLIVLYLVPIDRRPWYSGEGTSPLRVELERRESDVFGRGNLAPRESDVTRAREPRPYRESDSLLTHPIYACFSFGHRLYLSDWLDL